MFTKPLNYIITKENLSEAYQEISKNSSGIDDVDVREFQKNLSKNLSTIVKMVQEGLYSPEPLKKIEIDKPNSDKKRPIGLSAIKDKLVQRVLYKDLNSYFDKIFLNNSYAYRTGKSTLKAINRTTEFLNQNNLVVLKADIENFFETIDHDILLKILDKDIKDKSIIRLISLFLQVGGFKEQNYDEHLYGVYQGDILSPLLSNIYLNEMDNYLASKNINFVRYADDFVLLFSNKNEAYKMLKPLKKYLKVLHLKLSYEKTKILHIKDGFTFLGVNFQGRNRNIEESRVQKSIARLEALSKDKSGFLKFVKEVNSYLYGLKNYYLKILTKNSEQYRSLQDALIDSLAHKVYISKRSKAISTKKEFKILLDQVNLDILFDIEMLKDKVELIIAKGYERYLAGKSYKDTSSKIAKKKNKYAKKFANDSTLHISTVGLMLGLAKNTFVLKRYGKVQKKFPINKVTRIVFEGNGYSLSTNVIKKCADNAISIDFISQDATSYASLITYKASMTQSVSQQVKLLNTPTHLMLAQEFIRGKAKNQLNYIKYLNKYHKLLGMQIDSIATSIGKIKATNSVNELMGYEGTISASYWDAIKLVLDVPFTKRVTYGAKDIVNSSLNYGYAFLYGKVQHSLVYAGLSLNISFLHSLDEKKPTLTFDMIEEFRTFIVDRTIISMLNKDEPIKLGNDGMLTKRSRQLIAKNIKEKLGSYTMWKKESRKIENIIQTQSFNLAKVVNGELPKYKAFIGKY
ncbi:MAG: CRISPR-associated endonuclease Cas1 [Sulfurimonas sp.]|nr:CRISPR-associated endonuclease Cas1 [Sulfurimonas sp.]